MGGAVTATIAWALSGITEPVDPVLRAALLVAIAVVLALREFGVLNFALPDPGRQVPQSVFRKRHAWAAVQFGFEMGTGVRTFVTASTPFIALAAVLLAGPPLPLAIVAGVSFGLARAVPPVHRFLATDRQQWDVWLERFTAAAKRTCAVTAALAALAVASLLLLA